MKREEKLAQEVETASDVIYTFLVYTMVHGCVMYAVAMRRFEIKNMIVITGDEIEFLARSSWDIAGLAQSLHSIHFLVFFFFSCFDF